MTIKNRQMLKHIVCSWLFLLTIVGGQASVINEEDLAKITYSKKNGEINYSLASEETDEQILHINSSITSQIEEIEEVNVLSLDGGGIRGIGTLTMLATLEMKTGKKVHELFDRIYGTSTGGLAGIMLARGYSATQVLDIYFDNAERIFHRDSKDAFTNPLGLIRANFDPSSLESVIRDQVGRAKLSDVKIPVAVTTVDNVTFKVKILSSEDDKTRNVSMLQAGRATSAAPTYFPAQLVETESITYYAIDGGVAVNNPSEVAYNHTRKAYKTQGKKVKINMYSFGTGTEEPLRLDNNAGKLGFGHPGNIPGFFMNVAAQGIEDKMDDLYQEDKLNSYGRFQFNLPFKIDLADVRIKTKDTLMQQAWNFTCQDDSFKKLVSKMRQDKSVKLPDPSSANSDKDLNKSMHASKSKNRKKTEEKLYSSCSSQGYNTGISLFQLFQDKYGNYDSFSEKAASEIRYRW